MLRLIGEAPLQAAEINFELAFGAQFQSRAWACAIRRKRPPAQPIEARLSNRLIQRDLFISEPSGTIRVLDRMPFRLS